MGMEKAEKKLRPGGYMTVSVAVILAISISLCLTLIEGCRRSTVMLVAECAIDTGINNILAEYHRELQKQYGLFFIDTSYGTDVADYKNTLSHMKNYVEKNLSGQEWVWELFGKDFIDLHWDEGEMLGVSVSSDDGGAVLRRQISDYMKEQLGVSYLEELLEWLDVVEENKLTGDWYREMKAEAEMGLTAWSTLQGEAEKTKAAGLIYFENQLKELQAGTLKLLLGIDNLSKADIAGEKYLSQRERLQGSGMNPVIIFADDASDHLLLGEYILRKTGCFTKENQGSRLKYETEYILCGKESDMANLSEIAERLFTIRTLADAVHILKDQEKMDLIKTISDAISAAVGLPEISALLQTLFVVIWSEFEALWDVGRLMEGERIPLIKEDSQWHYGVGVSGEEKNDETGLGLGYEDYLRIFLAFQSKQLTTYRLMDVMEMNIRQTPGNKWFRMDGCIDSVTVCIDLESGYGYQFFVTRNYGY